MKAAAIILAGGKSSRMGTNKALLKINEKTNIERTCDALKLLFDDIILVTNEPETYEFLEMKMIPDHYPGMGPLAGVHAGLTASDYDVNFIVACDMPFISVELAEALVHACGHYDAVIPVINGKQHPLFAVFHKKVAGEAAKSIEEGSLRMKHLLDRLHVLYVTESELQTYSQHDLERVFFNMNHPNEYEDAKKWAEAD
ncbi:molybdenum cofactor guanylyltransferase [Neobacillus vireti]|uniref:Probable molybdenum cofactor guanylyltransferase n=1 Tax=Neobacillus vireti LMG 21834 TaxID=1131730 RepID=A0AB94IKT1_9BACI|nr:molybdenum cofactor guanylyltransferase [Neobacillus vireti]ETI67686.1 molybdopterin-guanine dinucleotide biosynthesis protein A [Neobacillus vireti LMG 21834]KLT16685.1 molybdopterin-guanine dinucleotide biosynthesis protein A [Neobacillus vireti]